jgi:Ca2+-binding EF-hand superfamily protein
MLVAALLVAAAASPLLAVPPIPAAPVAPHAPMAPMAPRAMMPSTRAEVQAHVAAMFARHDANRDGFLTAEELQMRGQRANVMMRHMGPNGAPRAMGDANVAFDRLDVNHDGKITREEFGKAREIRIEKRVMMVNGQRVHGGELGMPQFPDTPAVPGQRREVRIVRNGGGMMGAALLQRADANHDGRVSLAEATGAALQHFDMMDANRDGRITPEERAAGRAHMMQMRKAG